MIKAFHFCYTNDMITLDALAEALRQSWSADTAYAASGWSGENPARGQCVVSSLVVQDYLGGDLVRYAVSGDGFEETHYVNQLADGTILDTTAAQYRVPVMLQQKPIDLGSYGTAREKRLADADTARRYALLRSRVKSYLDSANVA